MNDIQKAMVVFIQEQAMQFAHEDAIKMDQEISAKRAKFSYRIKKLLKLI